MFWAGQAETEATEKEDIDIFTSQFCHISYKNEAEALQLSSHTFCNFTPLVSALYFNCQSIKMMDG